MVRQARTKKNPSPNFLVRISSGGGGGVFHVRGGGGGGGKKFGQTKPLGGISRDFCRGIPGGPESLRKKGLFNYFGPHFEIAG